MFVVLLLDFCQLFNTFFNAFHNTDALICPMQPIAIDRKQCYLVMLYVVTAICLCFMCLLSVCRDTFEI